MSARVCVHTCFENLYPILHNTLSPVVPHLLLATTVGLVPESYALCGEPAARAEE